MSNSFSQRKELSCPRCGHQFVTETWLIVDASKQLDLLERIQAKTEHQDRCANCGFEGSVDAPILLYRPGEDPVLVFSPAAKGTSHELDEEWLDGLLRLLRESLGSAWQEGWKEQMAVVPRSDLASFLREGPALAERLRQEASLADLKSLRLGVDGQEIEVFALLPLLEAFIEARSRDKAKALLEAHPELLSQEAYRLLAELIEGARRQGDEQAVHAFEQRLALLRRCQEVGLEQAFRDEAAGSSSERRANPLEQVVAMLPDETRKALLEIRMASGSREAFSAALEARPDLTDVVEQARIALQRRDRKELEPILKEVFQPAELGEMPRRIELCRHALVIVVREAEPDLWASLQSELAIALAQNPAGDHGENQEEAIGHFQQALEVHTRQASPKTWAGIQNNLGNVYLRRTREERAENLEQAIHHYHQALDVFTRQAFPQPWAGTQHSLGDTYLERIRGEQAENQEQSILHYQQALEVFTNEAFPEYWATIQHSLGALYLYRTQGEQADNQEQAIFHFQQALEVGTREASQQVAMTQFALATTYLDRIRGERAENQEQAIFHLQQALEVGTREASQEWAMSQFSLANTYLDRIRGERAENEQQANYHYLLAQEVFTRQSFPQQWADIQHRLGNISMARIGGERAESLEQAIHLYRRALEVRTRQTFPEDWADTQCNLGTAYQERIRGERANNLEQAIQLYQEALEVRNRQAFPEHWAMIQHDLGNAYRMRIRGQRAENLELAIQLCQQALEVFTREAFPLKWAITQCNLGNAYQVRIRGEWAENQELAILHYQQALEVGTREAFPREWAATHQDLGNSYINRIRGERAENQEQAIHNYELALEVRTRQAFPIDWATTQINLGNAYLDRTRGERAENLEQAIVHFQQALEVFTRQAFPEQWARTLHNLGNAYWERIRGGRVENVEQAILLYQQALEVRTREAFPKDWAMTQDNLGNAYLDRIWGERAENLEQAIHLYHQALEVRTRHAFPQYWAMTQHNLGCSYYARIRGERPENLEEAIFHLQQALEVHSPLTNPAMSRKTAQKLGEACLALQSWDQAAAAFGKAIAADEILYQAALGQVGREIEMAEAGDIYSLAAYASAKAGFLLQALEALEQGRARTLRDALERNRRDLEQLAGHGYAELYRRYQEASRSWQELRRHSTSQRSESTPIHSQARQPELVAELEAAQSEILAIVDEIQQVPGYEDFLRSLPAGSIQALSQQTPLIYLFATSQGGLGLVVSGGVICPVWLDALSYKDLMEALLGPAAESGYLVAYAHWREVITNREASTVERLAATDAWHAAIEAATEWLWKACMKQVVKILQEQRIHQVALIPGGLLGLLPLHAAWTSDARRSSGRRYALDKISFTYAPSAHVLRSAQAGAARPANTLLAIDNPGMDDPELELRFSGEEVASAAEHFESANIRWLVGEAASVDRIKAELSAYQVLHFSTHGLAVPVEPLESFLLLANREKLTLREILELRLDTARLAVLSACETGIPGTTLPDEVVSLPAGLMQAGVPGVIGSLWSVRDASTMMLMARLYDLWRKENYEPPEALRLAQIWLRDTTNGQKEAYFKHSLREHIRMKMSELAPREALHQLLLEDKEDRSFAHPFHWAAFGYMGV